MIPADEVQLLQVRLRDRETALARRDELLAIVAHERPTPATAILGWSRIVAGGMVSGSGGDRAVHAIARSSQLQLPLLNDRSTPCCSVGPTARS